MIFKQMKLEGAYTVELKKFEDERGFFARGWCQKEFEEAALVPKVVQANISFNPNKGTLRGMHMQLAPYEETKFIRCTRGGLYDVIVDLRPDSATFKQWIGVELSQKNMRMLYVPRGFAHGFQTLEDDTEAFYMVSEFYTPNAEQGYRYDDPAFRIEWPLKVGSISEKDRNWADF